MMKPSLTLLLFLSLMSIAFTAQAKIYQWTDSNGQKHFSQTPPPKVQGKKAPKVEIRKEKFKINRGVKKTKHGSFCGEISLPVSDDPVIQLANVEYRQKHWLADIQRQQKRLRKFFDEQYEFDRNPNKSGDNSGIIKRTEQNLEDLECAHSWSKRETARLFTVRKDTEEKLEAIREEYAEIKNRCGEKPDIQGWTNDKEAIEWAKCESNSSGISKHNKKLRELKAMESKASILNTEQD
ncbi:DUF4124 domain-containing protein [Cocleimonas flava]|uniref:Uncharacterized protein DUF4124 n=1 Tax=Cocleimonas flava TaxID=634765 RepID=A0A4R1EVT9_9GAMM|nr:DUF4124 domain-containing protein [Cocleimonas flava]TCJ83238.1 uncharacterized protein DUF4124 [Cocleimonas flava]